MLFLFFFKQKTAYEMLISDWSSDVCSSDLHELALAGAPDLRLTVGARRHDAGVRLDIGLMHRLGGVAARDHDLGRGEAGVGVAQDELDPLRDIRRRFRFRRDAGGEDVVVQQRRTVRHRVLHVDDRSEEHTSELQSLMRISSAVFCLTTKTKKTENSLRAAVGLPIKARTITAIFFSHSTGNRDDHLYSITAPICSSSIGTTVNPPNLHDRLVHKNH